MELNASKGKPIELLRSITKPWQLAHLDISIHVQFTALHILRAYAKSRTFAVRFRTSAFYVLPDSHIRKD